MYSVQQHRCVYEACILSSIDVFQQHRCVYSYDLKNHCVRWFVEILEMRICVAKNRFRLKMNAVPAHEHSGKSVWIVDLQKRRRMVSTNDYTEFSVYRNGCVSCCVVCYLTLKRCVI